MIKFTDKLNKVKNYEAFPSRQTSKTFEILVPDMPFVCMYKYVIIGVSVLHTIYNTKRQIPRHKVCYKLLNKVV